MAQKQLSLLAAAHLRHKSCLHSRYRARGAAVLATQHEKALLAVKQCVGRLAHVADDVLVHVATQNTLKHLGCEASLHNEALLSIERSRGTQLSVQVSHDVLTLPVHRLAQLREVDKDGLLGSFTQHLGGLENGLGFFSSELGIVGAQNAEDAAQQLLVVVVAGGPLPRQPRAALLAFATVVFLIGICSLAIQVVQTVQVQHLLFLFLFLCTEVPKGLFILCRGVRLPILGAHFLLFLLFFPEHCQRVVER
mmetsp:Transcript_3389/g.6677  ORF Transcript_3389/g.6677 Transcript_3389/m.6677 type:complete len:251 (+) Transcript_3389:647-1399(+)